MPSNFPGPTNWSGDLANDASTCFSLAFGDLRPQIDACTRLIDSGRGTEEQKVAAYRQRGYHQRLSQPDRALEDYNAALNIQPNAARVLTNRAFIYMTRAQYDAALEDLNRAIQLFLPAQAATARYLRGFTYARLKDYDKAMTDLNEAQRLDPKNPDPYLARGEVELTQQQYEAAMKDFNEVSKLLPKDPRGLIGRSGVFEATGRMEEALAAANSAVELAPTNTRAIALRDRLASKRDSDKP